MNNGTFVCFQSRIQDTWNVYSVKCIKKLDMSIH